MSTKIVLTGKPGIGKTTVVKKVAEKLKENAIGFWTEEFRDEKTGRRLGFKIITTEGKEAILASKLFFYAKNRVGSYGVDVHSFEETVLPVLERGLKEDKILIIDEIGKMELFSKKFAALIKKLFEDKNKTILATVPVKNVDPLIKWIKTKPDVILINVDYTNRNFLPEEIYNLLSK